MQTEGLRESSPFGLHVRVSQLYEHRQKRPAD
jgi:hypothetical protein